jgi:hypothetical protein
MLGIVETVEHELWSLICSLPWVPDNGKGAPHSMLECGRIYQEGNFIVTWNSELEDLDGLPLNGEHISENWHRIYYKGTKVLEVCDYFINDELVHEIEVFHLGDWVMEFFDTVADHVMKAKRKHLDTQLNGAMHDIKGFAPYTDYVMNKLFKTE